jgi:glycosyltransferase involved in cell wall biosynthesis
MRIALYHSLPSGGAKRAVFEWTRRLSVSHPIDVYSMSTANHDFCDIRPYVQAHHVFDFTPHRPFGSPWGRLNRLQRWRDLGQLTHISRRIAQIINADDYSIVFAHPGLFTFIPILMRFLEMPTVFYLHEPFGPTFERRFERPYLKRNTKLREISKRLDPFYVLYAHRLEQARGASVKQTTQLLANSKFTREQIKLQYGVDAPVCYCGVDTNAFRPIPGITKEDCVISVGSLTPHKGFDFLIKSLAHIPVDGRPALKLVSNWVSPDEKRYLEDLAARCNVELHILVNLDTEGLALEYNKASVCVYAPILESFGLVPLEAMACGIPVVGVGEAGVRETVLDGETGILTGRDPHHFAQAVQDLLQNSARRLQMGHRGRECVEKKWKWEHSVQALELNLTNTIKQFAST